MTGLYLLKQIHDFVDHFVVGLVRRADRHHLFLMAGGLAFSLFVCIIPFVLIIFAVLGRILEQPSIAKEIHTFIFKLIPYRAYAVKLEEIVFARVNEFTIYKSLAGTIGLVGLFFAASGLFSSMRTILNSVFNVVSSQSFLIGKLRDLGLVVLVMSYFMLSTTILPTIDVMGEMSDSSKLFSFINVSYFEQLFISIFSFLVIFLAFFTLYYLIPQQKIRKRVILVSALSAALMWEVAKQLFGLYIANVVTLKKVYGAYVFVIISATWVYYTSVVFIVGAEIGQLYREWRNRKKLYGG